MTEYAGPDELREMLGPIRTELDLLRPYADRVQYQQALLLDAGGQYPISRSTDGRVALHVEWHDDHVDGSGVGGERLLLQMMAPGSANTPDVADASVRQERTMFAALEQNMQGDWCARLDRKEQTRQLHELWRIADNEQALSGARRLAQTILGAYGQGNKYLQGAGAPAQAFTDASFRQLWQLVQADLDAAGAVTFYRYDYTAKLDGAEVQLRAMDTLPRTNGRGVVTGLVRAVTTIRSPAFQFSHIMRGDRHQARFVPGEPLPADLPSDPEIEPPSISARTMQTPEGVQEVYESFLPDLLDPTHGLIVRTRDWGEIVRQRRGWMLAQRAADAGLFELDEVRAEAVAGQLKQLSNLAMQQHLALDLGHGPTE